MTPNKRQDPITQSPWDIFYASISADNEKAQKAQPSAEEVRAGYPGGDDVADEAVRAEIASRFKNIPLEIREYWERLGYIKAELYHACIQAQEAGIPCKDGGLWVTPEMEAKHLNQAKKYAQIYLDVTASKVSVPGVEFENAASTSFVGHPRYGTVFENLPRSLQHGYWGHLTKAIRDGRGDNARFGPRPF